LRFLLDNSISQAVGSGLRESGHDVVHVKDYGMDAAGDDEIIARAQSEDRIVVTYDLDFPRILSLMRRAKPSLIVFRKVRSPQAQLELMLARLSHIGHALDQGCIAIFEPARIRVRELPLSKRGSPVDE
jgi:predicted nuclease of predicted toxin-antitoxin system